MHSHRRSLTSRERACPLRARQPVIYRFRPHNRAASFSILRFWSRLVGRLAPSM
jgi:hypothetical protein